MFGEVVLMSTHNLCFEQKYENYQNFHFLVEKFSIYLNRGVFVIIISVQIIRVNNYHYENSPIQI